MNRRDEFFEFELKNKLFDIVDERGLRPWEAVRYHVYNKVNYGNVTPTISYFKPSKRQKFWLRIRHLFFFFVYLLRHCHCKYMFLLCSRDKKDDSFYDKICGSLYDMVNKQQSFAIETVWHDNHYKYQGETCVNALFPIIKMLNWNCYDYRGILKKIKEHFGDLDLECDELEGCYSEFLSQYYIYKFLFRFCGIKKAFIAQNGIQKGLFAAAQEIGVEVFEFQHGQLSRNHPAYSYPNSPEMTAEKVYHPAKLLTFGPFWHKNRVYPGVENIVIGNNFYYDSIEIPDMLGNKKILVISNCVDGDSLARYVKDILMADGDFFFYFKLHPNQYNEFDYYIDLFKDYPNVKVVSDGLSVNQLLAKVEAIFLFHSTAVLEALRAGRKVYIVKESAYLSMDFVFDEPGVFLVDNVTDFMSCYNMHCNEILKPRGDIFIPFQPDVASNLLSV